MLDVAKVVLLGLSGVDLAQHGGADLALCLPAAQFLVPLHGTSNKFDMASEPVAQPAVVVVLGALDGEQLVGNIADIGVGQPLGGDGGVTYNSVDGLSGDLSALLVIPAEEGALRPGGNGQSADGCVIGDSQGSGINAAAVGIQGQGVVAGIPDRVSLDSAALDLGKGDFDGLAQFVELLVDDPAQQFIAGADKALAIKQGHRHVVGVAVLEQHPVVAAGGDGTNIGTLTGVVSDGVGIGAPDCVSLDGVAILAGEVLVYSLAQSVSPLADEPANQMVAITNKALTVKQSHGSIVGVAILDLHPVVATGGDGAHIGTFTGIVLDGVAVGLPDCVGLNGTVLNGNEVLV